MDQFEWIAVSGQPVVHALQDQGAAVSLAAGGDFIRSQPQRAHDADVERALCVMRAQLAGEGKAQVGDVAGRAWPLIDADQGGGPELPAGFFERFARAGGDQCFAGFEMAGRLVEAQAVFGVLFDQQETPVALDQRSDRDIGLPLLGFHGWHCNGREVSDAV